MSGGVATTSGTNLMLHLSKDHLRRGFKEEVEAVAQHVDEHGDEWHREHAVVPEDALPHREVPHIPVVVEEMMR